MSGAVVLIGLSGSGKSTLGHALAARLGLPLLDTDRLIEAQAAKPVAAIFGAGDPRGGWREQVFRDLEQAAVTAACARAAVVAVGGGAVLRPANRRAMRRGNLVVWLDLPPAVLARRLATHAEGEERPLLRTPLGGDLEDRLRALWLERRPLYAASAHVRLGVFDEEAGSGYPLARLQGGRPSGCVPTALPLALPLGGSRPFAGVLTIFGYPENREIRSSIMGGRRRTGRRSRKVRVTDGAAKPQSAGDAAHVRVAGLVGGGSTSVHDGVRLLAECYDAWRRWDAVLGGGGE